MSCNFNQFIAFLGTLWVCLILLLSVLGQTPECRKLRLVKHNRSEQTGANIFPLLAFMAAGVKHEEMGTMSH